MKLDVLDITNKKVGQVELPESIFGIEPNDDVLLQYIRVYSTNHRQGNASTKTRAEVSGGGVKPRPQKGSGKSRQGSIRSPIWVHGGVAHGPKPKDWELKMPKKMLALALKLALSAKVKDNKIVVLDDVILKEGKTKEMASILSNLGLDKKTLFVWNKADAGFKRASANIPHLTTAFSGNLNAYDVLSSDNIIFLKDGIKVLEEKYAVR